MAQFRQIIPAEIRTAGEGLGDDEVEVVMSTGNLARDGHILDPGGADIESYRSNPIILWQHDPKTPVGTAPLVAVDGNKIRARVRFASPGISPEADKCRGLVKDGIINAVSVGFDAIDGTPIDPKKPKGGQHFTRWALLECSFVSIPADTGAVITARELSQEIDDMAEWKCGAARNLKIQDGDPAWDGAAATASIFEFAGGDDFDPATARRGFLAYDSEAPKLRGSYKLPIAHVVDGELVVPKSALRAASGAHGVGGADIGDATAAAQKVLDAYKKRAGIGEDDKRAKPARIFRAHRGGIGVMVRGLYDIGRLAWLLDSLCDAHWSAQVEAAFEGDGSQVPAMLAKAMQELGAALIAMTEEEVGEALEAAGANIDDDDDGDGLDPGATVIIQAAHSAEHKRFLIGYQRAIQIATRAGKKHSAATIAKMDEALGHHDDGMKAAREALRCFGRAANCVQGMRDDNGCDCSSDPDADNYDPDCDCDRAVSNSDDGKNQDASQTIQTSDGVAKSDGSDNGRAARQRELDAMQRRGESLAMWREPTSLVPV